MPTPTKKPAHESCSFVRRFHVANERALYIGNFARYHAHVGGGQLWLSERLSIPLDAIYGKEIVARGWLIKRWALRVEFGHPDTHVRDVVHLCDLNLLGLYRQSSLEALSSAIDDARPGPTIPARASIPPIATRGVRELFAALIGNAILSRERLAMRYYKELAESQGLDRAAFQNADEARHYIARESIAREGPPLDAEQLLESERKHVLAGRVLAVWFLFWLVLLPVWVTAGWATDLDESSSIAIGIGLVMGYCIAASFSLLAAWVLERPFLWLTGKVVGIDIVYHSRRHW